MIKTAGFILAITTACLPLTWSEDTHAQQPAGSRDRDVSQNGDVWWHQMFSMSFDGHGNFVVPHLDILNTTAASFGAAGFHGVWDADLNRDMPWMRGHVAEFQKHADVRKVFYIEGAGATKVLCRVGRDGRILFSAQMLDLLNDPETSAVRRAADSARWQNRMVWRLAVPHGPAFQDPPRKPAAHCA